MNPRANDREDLVTQRFNISCSSCSQKLAVDRGSAGKQVKCPKCGVLLVVPKLPAGSSAVDRPAGSHAAGGQAGAGQPAGSRSTTTGSGTQPVVTPSNRPVTVSGSEVASASQPKAASKISCGNCKTVMSVRLLDKPSTVQCPKCSTKLQLPANGERPTGMSHRPHAASHSGPTPGGSSVVSNPVTSDPHVQTPVANTAPSVPSQGQMQTPIPQPSNPGFASTPPNQTPPSPTVDFGSINTSGPNGPMDDPFGTGGALAGAGLNSVGLDSVGLDSVGLDSVGLDSAMPASNSFARPARTASGNGFLNWVKKNPMLCVIVVLNAIVLLVGIFNFPLLIFAAVQIPIGGLLVGGLFLPRLHLIDRFGQKIAGIGVGGFLLLICLGGVRAYFRLARRRARAGEDLDMSWMSDPSAIGTLVGSVAVFLMFAGLFVFLWKQFGVIRVLAGCYIAELSIFGVLLFIGGVINAQRDAEVEAFHEQARQRHQEMIERMNQRTPGGVPYQPPPYQPPPYQPPNFATRSGNPGGTYSRSVDPDSMRLIVIHSGHRDKSELLSEILDAIGNPDHETISTTPIRSELIIRSPESPQDIASRINSARSVSTNSVGRMITVIY